MATSTRAKEMVTTRPNGTRLAVVFLLAIAALAIVSVFAVLALGPGLNVQRLVEAPQQARAADAARYDAMTAYYTAQVEAPQPVRAIDAARYNAMTYIALVEAPQQARVADAARYDAMTAYYTTIQVEEAR